MCVNLIDVSGRRSVCDGLSLSDDFIVLKAKAAKAFDIPFGLTTICLGDSSITAHDHHRTLRQLGVKDGMDCSVNCKAPVEMGGYFYALTEARVSEDGDISQAVRAEFGNDGRVAEWHKLSERSQAMTKEEFAVFLDSLGPFVTAHVFCGGHKRGSYVQRDRDASLAIDKHANVHKLLTFRHRGFHPMYVLVDLGVATECVSRLGELSSLHFKALKESKTSLIQPGRIGESINAYTVRTGRDLRRAHHLRSEALL